jgi:pilus assembly protein Flp/PilA
LKKSSIINQIICSESGATAIEYGLIAALVSVAAVTAMRAVGTSLGGQFNSVATAFGA